MKDPTFYYCTRCENLFLTLNDSGAVPSCCGTEMVKLVPNSVDASNETHMPAFELSQEKNKITVTIGSKDHPMIDSHKILWIMIHTSYGYRVEFIDCCAQPTAEFALKDGEKVHKIYAYCNIHKLWEKVVEDA